MPLPHNSSTCKKSPDPKFDPLNSDLLNVGPLIQGSTAFHFYFYKKVTLKMTLKMLKHVGDEKNARQI